ncbi:MAG TPA: DUF3298 and DUF4163 domain-containing protein [Limnochordia bacterium]|nr:DUF3298 and DUF4163 domain-containing protein [Limnochordia bacterium]
MGKLRLAALVVVVLLCSLGTVQAAKSYWQRMAEGYPNQLVVYEYVYEYRSPELEVSARVPQLGGALDLEWQQAFNQEMREMVHDLAASLEETAKAIWELEEIFHAFPFQGIVDFEVKLNRGGLLSLELVTYTFTGGAHGMTFCDYINIDLTTGRQLTFWDLFDTEEEVARAAEAINERIAQEPEWFFIDQFTPGLFSAEQGFYLTDEHVVICFGLYELAPYAAGIQEFPVAAP